MREEIEKKFSKRISVSTTIELSDEIEKTTSKKISPTTLQRFFELVSNKSQPSKYTLNVLSDFVGYSSFDDLKNKSKEDLPISNNEKLITDEFGITLFNLCLKNHHFDAILEYLELLPKEKLHFPTQLKIANSFGNILRKDPKAREALLPQLAKTTSGRTYFYESFVDIDFLNVYFQKALTNFYLPNSKPYNQPKYLADFVFTKAIEFIAQVKAKREKKAIKVSYELFQKVDVNIACQKFIHPFPYARLMSVYVISEYLKNNLSQQKVDFVIENIENVIINQTATDATFMLAQLIMALNYCKQPHIVIEIYTQHQSIIDNSIKDSSNYMAIISCLENSYQLINKKFNCIKEKTTLEFFDATSISKNKTPII